MESLASAARRLANCRTARDLTAVLQCLGFDDSPLPVPPEKAAALDLSKELIEPRVAAGKGALRALVFDLAAASDSRAVVSRVASHLASRAPHFLWLIGSVQSECDRVVLAVFECTRSRPRVHALFVDTRHVVDSDAETLCAMGAVVGTSDVFCHSRWSEILGRESVSRKFFRELERLVRVLAESLAPFPAESDASELSLLYVSRLLFLAFLETKGWLDRDRAFLANRFADCMMSGGGYHRRVLRPLFFGTLNTPPARRALRAREFGSVPFLNGGLFARSALEARTGKSVFTDEAIGDLFGDLLSRYRFTAREDGATWTEAAIDPEMLGKAFESLMSARYRKTSGAFYTPQSMVREVVNAALRHGLTRADQVDDTSMLRKVAAIRVLDPSCGSGAFLISVLEVLSAMRAKHGDSRPMHLIRRDILSCSIFGVDVNPTAVWLCELRLWLSMAIEDPETNPSRVAALPNLDRNIRVGDSLAGDPFVAAMPRAEGRRVAAMRGRYSRATGPKKRALGRSLDRLERQCAIEAESSRALLLAAGRREMLTAIRSPDLFGSRLYPTQATSAKLDALRRNLRTCRREIARLRSGGALPFSFAAQFADAAADGGFDVVVGNPPWVRTHNVDAKSRESLRARFTVYKSAGWSAGAQAAGAGKGFGSQVDLAALFIERCIDLLKDEGIVSLVTPAKLWRSLAGGGVRQLVADKTQLLELHDLTSAPQVFEAAVYPSVIVARRKGSRTPSGELVDVESCTRQTTMRFKHELSALPFDDSPGSPWIAAPLAVRRAFDLLRSAGTPLHSSPLGRPLLGVKTGCNDAFLVSPETAKSAGLETELLRPVLRGDGISRFSHAADADSIIWTHDPGGPMRSLPPAAAEWMRRRRGDLERRTDARRSHRWWRLFRTECADSSKPRVAWADIGRKLEATVIAAGDPIVPINSCYVLRCRTMADALATAALFNSPLVDAWLALLAEPARGGYRRYMGWTLSLLPIPSDWLRAREILSPFGRRGISGNTPDEQEIHEAMVDAYGIDDDKILPLLEWNA